jgi:carbamoyl-phosphate synthase large subunit
MKSVGEVMAMGRTFQESFQKALRGLETGKDGFDPTGWTDSEDDLRRSSASWRARPGALWYVGDAFRAGMSVDEVHALTQIDRGSWTRSRRSSPTRRRWRPLAGAIDARRMQLKRKGFSDARLAKLLGTDETAVRALRQALGVRRSTSAWTPAREFATDTAYMYSTYEDECEAAPTNREKIMVLGGGPNRIGQGIEFDYCCVHAALALREDGYETIMVNCNPETVSTDYDTSDRLYFEPLTLEDVLEIVDKEKPKGVIVQYGGQTPLKLAWRWKPTACRSSAQRRT